jgi:protein O-mannosyl-transferase
MTYDTCETYLSKRLLVALALLLAVTALAYAGSLKNGLVWDDHDVVEQNALNRSVASLPQLFTMSDSISGWPATHYYRPLARATYLLDYQLFGLKPWGYHLENLLLHLANVLLLFCVARTLFGANLPSLFASALFALHPGIGEPVFAVFARNTLMALLFMLLTFLAFHRGIRSDSRGFIAMAAFLLFLGLLSKETALMIVPVLIWQCRDARVSARGTLLRLLPVAGVVIIYGALRYNALRDVLPPLQATDLATRLANDLYVVPRYLLLLLFPARLTVWHEVPAGLGPLMPVLVCTWLLLVAGVIAAVGFGGKVVRFALFWGGCMLVPLLGVMTFPGAPMAERHLYIPLAGLSLGAAALWVRLPARFSGTGMAAAGIVLALFAGRTVARSADWQSDLTLFRSAVAVNPSSATARFNLGNAYQQAGNPDAALREWQTVVALDPRAWDALNEVGRQHLLAGRHEEALDWFRRAVDATPDGFGPRNNLAVTLDLLGRTDAALREYERLLASLPADMAWQAPRIRQRIEQLRGNPSPHDQQ